MERIDRVIFGVLAAGLWVFAAAHMLKPETADARLEYSVKRDVIRIIEGCSVTGTVSSTVSGGVSGTVSGQVYMYSLPYGEIEGGSFNGTLDYGTLDDGTLDDGNISC